MQNKRSAINNLNITEREWGTLGRLANMEPLEQGRHRGKAAGSLRPAKKQELDIARKCAAKFVEKYLIFLETQ
jgi:hypothetical protein